MAIPKALLSDELEPEGLEALGNMNRPIPGQSLTGNPDEPRAWEGPPQFTNMREALDFVVEFMMEEEVFIALTGAVSQGIPISDMIKVKNHLNKFSCTMVGPNCPGVITPNEAKVGIMPGFIFKKGKVGIISKSGTLTYEAADQVVKQGFGISTAIGIGGDPIIGTTVKDAMEMFVEDSETKCIVMIGEIGGQLEAEAAKWYSESNSKKPVVGFIAGETAPIGRTMGHAGAIVGGSDDTAKAKKKILINYGVNVVDSPAEIGKKVHSILS